MKFGVRELLFVVLLLAIPMGAYFWIFNPANENVESQRQEIEAKTQKLASLQKALVGIKDLNEEVEKLQEAVGFFEAKLPKRHEIHRVLEQVTKVVEQQRLETKLFKTLKAKTCSGYSEQPIRLELSGNFNAFYEFMLELEKLPRITKFRVMHLEKDQKKEGMMIAELELSIYFDSSARSSSVARG